MLRHERRNPGRSAVVQAAFACVLACSGAATPASADDDSRAPIRLASILDLAGNSRLLGEGMRAGLEAALFGASVHGHPIEVSFHNDSYSPPLTRRAASRALAAGAVAMVGNVGTPTARAILPVLERAKVPAVGFYTGADLLRTEDLDGVFNVRASYDQEIAALVTEATANGIAAAEFCAVAQNDAFGNAGLRGLARALDAASDGAAVARSVRAAVSVTGHSARRNGVGPVGFFERESPAMYHAYRSLKHWEDRAGTRCAVVLTIGTYRTVGRFQAYSRHEGETWLVASLSFTGAEALGPLIHGGPPDDRVVMMQVVPPLDSALPVVSDARNTLGRQLGYISLEGYIAGRLMRAALEAAPPNPTAQQVASALRDGQFSLGGLEFDFSTDNQALEEVHVTFLHESGWRTLDAVQWRAWRPKRPLQRLSELLP